MTVLTEGRHPGEFIVNDASGGADVAASREEGRVTGVAEGRQAERTRIGAIIGHAEAAGREQLARHLAFETDMSVDAAVGLLTAAPKAATTTRTDTMIAGLAIEPVSTAEDQRAIRSLWAKTIAAANESLGN